MTIEKFIEKKLRKDIDIVNIGKIPNKRLAKIIKSYKYIDINEYWYDDLEAPEENTWVDIEGIGYGWIWLNYKSKKKLRKTLQRWALNFHRNEPVWTVEYNDIKYYLFSLEDEVVEIRLSRKELDPEI